MDIFMITKSILIIMTEEPINILESIKQGLQDIVVPEMREIKSDIRRLDDKIESARNELKAEIHRLDDKMVQVLPVLMTRSTTSANG